MTALDQVNDRFGKKTMVLASEGKKRSWKLHADFRSASRAVNNGTP